MAKSHLIDDLATLGIKVDQNLSGDYKISESQLRKLYELATTDPMTGLHNRRPFAERLREAVRSKENFSVLMIDIDDFKAVNTVYGHAVGDQVIQFVVKTIKEHSGRRAVIARMGGDEIAVLIRNNDSLVSHYTRAGEIQSAVGAGVFHLRPEDQKETETLRITVSVGFRQVLPSEQRGQDFLKEAGLALQEAKRQGKNRVVSYDQIR